MRPVVGYIRVSTNKQGKSGIGLEGQRAFIEEAARLGGYSIVQIYSDVASATGPATHQNRLGLQNAITQAQQLGCPILLSDISRLSRNLEQTLRIAEEDEVEIMAPGVGMKRMVVVKSLAMRAEKEGALNRQRSIEGIAKARDRGVRFGNTVNLPEAREKALQSIKEKASERHKKFEEFISTIDPKGVMAVSDIVEELNRRGFRTAQGKQWSRGNVYRLLKGIAVPPPPKGVESIFNSDNRLTPSARTRVAKIMAERHMLCRNLMRELGFKPLNKSVMDAVSKGNRIKNPALREALGKWLENQ
jgi:DNA invertase Pin-like site-specific DNA recombinase